MKKEKLSFVGVVIGIIISITGFLILKLFEEPQGFMLALPYICIGVGCGIFGHSMGNVISQRTIKNHPEIERQIEIEKNDERNIQIINYSKSKAFDMMTYIFGLLLLCFAFMGVKTVELLLLVAAYLFVQIYAVYNRCKYEKQI